MYRTFSPQAVVLDRSVTALRISHHRCAGCAYTVESAFAEHQETIKGSIEPGWQTW
jgi:hypothetical protein